jgi:hypothetical protein
MNTPVIKSPSQRKLTRSIRQLIVVFGIGLVLSGITAFPIEFQLGIANKTIEALQWKNDFTAWVQRVYQGVYETNSVYPFMAYGTDWLAFAHLVIAVSFIGPLRDPVRNIWVIEFGLIACAAIFPLAFIAGSIRGIPVYWQLIDCSFGLVGGTLLYICRTKILKLQRIGEK